MAVALVVMVAVEVERAVPVVEAAVVLLHNAMLVLRPQDKAEMVALVMATLVVTLRVVVAVVTGL